MAFTYSDALTLDRDRVRFSIADTVSGSGPKPADANFSDAEIAGLITIEGTWQRATAAAFENLAALWTRQVTFSAGDMSASLSNIAEGYRSDAETWRKRWGYAGGTASGSSATTRADGYSDDLDCVTTEDST